MESEIALLRDAMTNRQEQMRAGVIYYTGKIEGVDVTLLSCGVGKVNAAMHTQILIDDYAPDVILQSGVAGALSPKVNLYDVVIGNELCYHDMQDFVLDSFTPLERSYFADPALVDLAANAAKDAIIGKIATGDQFIADLDAKKAIWEKTHALCTEMEGAAVAHTAYLNEIPFVTIRVISDHADAAPEVTFAVFEKTAAKKSAEIVLRMLPNITRAIAKRKEV